MSASPPTPELLRLARSCGVATGFTDWRGEEVVVSAATLGAVLTAMGLGGPAGLDPDDTDAVRAAQHEVDLRPWRRMLPPAVVVPEGRGGEVAVHLPHGAPLRAELRTEDGGRLAVQQLDRWVDPREVDGRLVGEATLALPGDLPLGWHTLTVDAGGTAASCAVVVTPGSLELAESARPGKRSWGWMVQLYAVRSRRSWGSGDLRDLADLCAWSGHDLGADFVLVNPLHAPAPTVPVEPSPYLPSTRRFVSPLYIRVEDVPEHGYLTAAAQAEIERLALLHRTQNSADTLLDRDAVWAAKHEALAMLHTVPRSAGREAAYAAFREREGEGLRNFATWCALAEVHGARWSEWPAQLRDPGSAAVAAARDELGDRVDFFCWLQWVADEQLAAAQHAGREAGMAYGVVHDLAVGVHPDGADTWALQDVLASGVTVGAPPDAFSQLGQDWSQPPWRPDGLADTGYAPLRDMARTLLRHAGGLRIDHVIGLFRLWWIPEGRPPTEGTYVRYDHDAMVGVLALEAHRAGAFLVGEDLGTVEPWVREYLADRGVLGTSILWFERDWDVRDERGMSPPLDAQRWRSLCLATVATHDLPPTSGYLAGEHIRVRDELGLLTRPVAEERAVDDAERASWLDHLRAKQLLADGGHGGEVRDDQATVEALHRYLGRTPARLVGVALADAVGDRRTVNQPGTHQEYPNWRVPMTGGDGRPVLLDDLASTPRVAALAAAVREGLTD